VDIQGFLSRIAHERLAGTDGERKACDVIAGQLADWGVTPVLEPFEINAFDPGTATVSAGDLTVSGFPVGLVKSVTTSGRLVLLENSEILRHQKGAYRGCVVLTYGFTRQLSELLAIGGARAAICIGGPDRQPACLAHRQRQYETGVAAPIMTITYADGLKLLRQVGGEIRLRIEQCVRRATATNIVTTLGSSDIDESLVYVVAHYDSVHSSEGATDNAAGVACVLSLIDQLRASPPPREVRFVLFSAEELGLLGSRYHVQNNVAEIDDRARLVINIDISGDPIATDAAYVMGTRELKGYAAGILREAGLMFNDSLSLYSSDGIPFAIREVPSVNLARAGGEATGYIHTPGDSMRRIAEGNFSTTISAATALLDRVLNARVFPVNREMDDSLREPLEKYIWGMSYEKPEIVWTEKYRKP
jgi:aminopeptidase YwaD